MAKLDFEIFNKAKKKKLLRELEHYGIKKLPYLTIKWGKRLRIFSGNLDRESISILLKELNVDSIGLHFATTEEGIKLSMDALHLLQEQISRGIIEISNEQTEQWFKGKDIDMDDAQKRMLQDIPKRFVILMNNQDIIGMGKKNSQGIVNFMPKERRIKN